MLLGVAKAQLVRVRPDSAHSSFNSGENKPAKLRSGGVGGCGCPAGRPRPACSPAALGPAATHGAPPARLFGGRRARGPGGAEQRRPVAASRTRVQRPEEIGCREGLLRSTFTARRPCRGESALPSVRCQILLKSGICTKEFVFLFLRPWSPTGLPAPQVVLHQLQLMLSHQARSFHR